MTRQSTMAVLKKPLAWLGLALVVMALPATAEAAAVLCPDEGFTYRAVSCIRNVFYEAVARIMPDFEAMAEGITYACVTFALALFGLKVLLSQTQDATGFGRDFIWLMVKIAAVMYLVGNFTDYYPQIVAGIDELLYAVVAPLINVSALTDSCPMPATYSSEAVLVWARVDCMLGAVLGFGAASGGIFFGIGEIFRAAFPSSLQDSDLMSAIGPIIGSTGVTMFFGILLSFFRAVYLFLVTYLGIAMCFLIAPFMFPLVLFRFTMQIFASWIQAILGFILQPVLIMAVISMMIIAMDKAFFTGEGSLAYVLGNGYTVCNIPADNRSCPTAPAYEGEVGDCRYDRFSDIMDRARACGLIQGCTTPVAGVNMEANTLAGCLVPNTQAGNQAGRNPNAISAYSQEELRAAQASGTPLCNSELLRALNPARTIMSGFINFSSQTTCLGTADSIEILGAFLTTAVLALIFYVLVKELPQIVGNMTSNIGLLAVRRGGQISQTTMPFENAFREGAAAIGSDISAGDRRQFDGQTLQKFQQSFMSGIIGRR